MSTDATTDEQREQRIPERHARNDGSHSSRAFDPTTDILLRLLDAERAKVAAALALHNGMHPCPLGGGDSLVYDAPNTDACPTVHALGL